MPQIAVSSQIELGARIAEARIAAGKTQDDLSAMVRLERSMLAKIEKGVRKVSATELVDIAEALGRPLDWFVFESPPAILSRRSDSGADQGVIDAEIELLARDVEFLIEKQILANQDRPRLDAPASLDEATALASEARRLLGLPGGPIVELQDACESAGLLASLFELGRENGDAAYVEVGTLGVALINGSADYGRRRFSLAHELGHHLVGDAFEPIRNGGSVGDTEKFINAFAANFLMPPATIKREWKRATDLEQRAKALLIASRYCVSWSSVCGHLRNLGLITYSSYEELRGSDPKRWEWLALRIDWEPTLVPPSIPREYALQVIEGYRAFRLTQARTLELLHGTFLESDLPELDEELTLDELRREFASLS